MLLRWLLALLLLLSPATASATQLSLTGAGPLSVGAGPAPPCTISDADAITLIAAMSPAPSAQRGCDIQTLIVALKAGTNVWSQLDIMYVLAAHASGPALLNWKSPASFVATLTNAPAFTVDQGFTGNPGASAAVSLNWNPSTNGVQFTQNSASIAAWSLSSGQDANAITGGSSARIVPRTAADAFSYRINQATSTTPANADGSGFFLATRSASNATKAFRNLVSLGTGSQGSTARDNQTYTILATQTSLYWSGTAAFVAYGSHMSDAEWAEYYAAVRAYMTAVGIP